VINVFQPTLGRAELDAVEAVFTSGWLGRGARTTEFETRFAQHVGVDPAHVVSTNSCTEALFVVAEMLGVGPGDEVVLPSISFVGAANAIAARGARPVFCDVDPSTLNPGVDDVLSAMSPATAAVVVLHYGGRPGAVADIAALCDARGIPLIEDAACAVSSTVDGRSAGTFGAYGAWSFDAMKILVTGDGGMLYVRDPDRAREASRRFYLGLVQGSGFARVAAGATGRWWEFETDGLSRRSITNDIASAIGLVQLDRLAGFVERRAAIARRYDERFADLPVGLPPALPDGHRSSHLFYWITLPRGVRDDVAARLLEHDVYTTFRYYPLHLVGAYAHGSRELPGATRASQETLCLPMHQGLDDDTVERVADEVRDAVLAQVRS
jgi:aminotransferase